MTPLLFLAHRIPYPPNKGDKIRSFHLLEHLAKDHKIFLGAFVDDPADWPHIADLQEYCSEVFCVPLSPRLAGVRSLAALWQRRPLTLEYYASAKMRRWVEGCVQRHDIRHVLVFSSAMGQYLPLALPEDSRCIVDFVDVDSQKWHEYGALRSWPLSWVYGRESRRLLEYEIGLAARASASIFVTRQESELFLRLAEGQAQRVSWIENGVDTSFFSPRHAVDCPYPERGLALVFTGAMDYWANVDAVCWFARDVFPEVIREVPQALFYIVGARPTEAVRSLEDLPGVAVTGAVPDTRPYLAHALAAVAPLRIARGIQNKVLEAMSMGRPVIATPSAMDGIRDGHGLEDLVSERPDRLAAAAVWMLTDKDARDRLGARAREFVVNGYQWATKLEGLRRLFGPYATQTVSHAGGWEVTE